VGLGRDFTIFATCDGRVKFERYSRKKKALTRVHVEPFEAV
jgi:large subunit ribosomal protein L27